MEDARVARRPAGQLEQEVLAVLAASGEALTPAQVQADLGDGLAYTTVMTALTRLHDKGAVIRERSGRAYAYRWAADRAVVTARQMRRLLDRDADRAGVLARFVAELGPEDGRLVGELLAEPHGPQR
jgi:predicted transcriptional regulator